MRIIDSNAYNIFGIPSPTEQASKFFLFRTRIVRQQSINGMTIPQKFSSKIFTVTNRIPNKMNVINYIGTRILCRIFIDDNIVLENRTCIQILCNTFQSSIDKPGKPVKFLPVRQEITATCILCRFLRNRNPHSIQIHISRSFHFGYRSVIKRRIRPMHKYRTFASRRVQFFRGI